MALEKHTTRQRQRVGERERERERRGGGVVGRAKAKTQSTATTAASDRQSVFVSTVARLAVLIRLTAYKLFTIAARTRALITVCTCM